MKNIIQEAIINVVLIVVVNVLPQRRRRHGTDLRISASDLTLS